ncbi:hypothetical protein [Chitinimonas naiadis]
MIKVFADKKMRIPARTNRFWHTKLLVTASAWFAAEKAEKTWSAGRSRAARRHSRLKQLLIDSMLDNAALKDLLGRNW